MSISFVHSKGADAPITIPAIGLDLMVRMAPEASGGAFSIIETINAPGKGRRNTSIPRRRFFASSKADTSTKWTVGFYADAGVVVSIPGGAGHGFVNVTDRPARQYILIVPALDAAAFFTELAAVMPNGVPEKAALNGFGVKWRVEFLGPPLSLDDQPTA